MPKSTSHHFRRKLNLNFFKKGISLFPFFAFSLFGTTFFADNAFAATFTSAIDNGTVKKNAIETAHFRFEFSDLIKSQSDADGDAVPDVVEIAAEAGELSWSVEIDEMGFDSPVTSKLMVVLDDTDEYLSEGSVGVTGVLSDGETPYIAIDPWSSEKIIQVTIAHELFHAIQFGDNVEFASHNQGVALAEELAVWFEDKVYDDINDYFGYLEGYTSYTDYSLFSSSSPADDPYFIYGLTLWPHFLQEYFNTDSVIKDIWNNYIGSSLDYSNEYKVYDAMKETIEGEGANIDETFQDFTLWNIDMTNYEEGSNYSDIYFLSDTVQKEYTLIDDDYVPALYGTDYLYFRNIDSESNFHFHIIKPEGVSFAVSIVPYKNKKADPSAAQKIIIGENEEMTEELVLTDISGATGVFAVISPLQKNFNNSALDESVFDEGYQFYYAGAFGQNVLTSEEAEEVVAEESSTEKEGVEISATDGTRTEDSLNLEIIDYDENSVSFKWNRLTDEEITHYEISIGEKSGKYTSSQVVEKDYITSATVKDLEADSTYYFLLSALDENEESLYESNELLAMPQKWIFEDVSYVDENYDAISSLTDWGIFKGYSDGTFQPDREINRAELLKILIAGQGISPAAGTYKNCFSDVGTEWYAPYICYAKSKKWISGYSDGSFRPSNYVNKVEALKMMLNTYGEKLTEGVKVNTVPYPDVNTTAWYAIYVWRASKLSVLEEVPEKNFYPQNYRTRAEMAAELYRYLVVNGLKHI